MEGIQVSTEVAGHGNQVSIIRVGGYIDTTTSSEVERALMGLLKQERYKIIIDLGNVDYISSAGWGIFISEIKCIRENQGDLKLVRMIPDVYEIFELLEFHHILDVYDTVEEAVQKFDQLEFAGVSAAGANGESAPPAMETESLAQEVPPPSASEFTTEPGTVEGEPSAPSEPEPVQSGAEKILHLSQLSDEEKVKYVVAHEPEIGAFKINKRLNSPEFGFSRIGWFGVRVILNRLGLKSRKSRRNFAEASRIKNSTV